MVSMHVHFLSSRYFVTFVCVSVLYCVFLFLVINRSVAGVIPTVVEENHPVAVVACPVAKVMQNCAAQVIQVHSDSVNGRLPFCFQNSSGDCCSPRQRSGIVGCHVTWHNLE